MTAAPDGVTKKKASAQSADQQAAVELVRLAGVSRMTGRRLIITPD